MSFGCRRTGLPSGARCNALGHSLAAPPRRRTRAADLRNPVLIGAVGRPMSKGVAKFRQVDFPDKSFEQIAGCCDPFLLFQSTDMKQPGLSI